MSQPLPIKCTPYPWCDEEPSSQAELEYSRRSIIVPGDVTEVIANVCDDSLPETARWVDYSGRLWKRFEIPCANWSRDDDTAARSELTLTGKHLAVRQMTVELAAGLPRPGIDFANSNETAEDKASNVVAESALEGGLPQASIALQRLTDSYIDFINDLVDHPRPHRHYWEENVDGAALRSVKRTLARWQRTGKRDEVRLALIVSTLR